MFEIALKTADDFLWGRPRKFSLDVVGEWEHHCCATHVKVEQLLNEWTENAKPRINDYDLGSWNEDSTCQDDSRNVTLRKNETKCVCDVMTKKTRTKKAI